MTSSGLWLMAWLALLGSSPLFLRGNPTSREVSHGGVTMRIDRYDPPLIAYEGSIEPGRKVPEWFDAFSTFYWPNQLQAQEEWHQILTPWTESIGVRMGSDLSELQANPAAYARYQPQYDIVRAVTFSNDAIRYVLVQMEFFDEVYRPKGSRAGQTCAFVDSPRANRHSDQSHRREAARKRKPM